MKRPTFYMKAVSYLLVTFMGLGLSTVCLALKKNPHAKTVFVFSPKTHSYAAYSNGKLVRHGKASGGSRFCTDIGRACKTPSGVYHIIRKGGPGCKSSLYPIRPSGRGGAPMPYCMFYNKVYAIHGSPEVPNYNASHGCIRIKPSDAKWLSQHFIRIGTQVVVKPY